MDRRILAFLLALVAVPLSGCLGGDDAPGAVSVDAAPDPGATNATLVAAENATSPEDLTGGHLPHLHNYWGENDRVVLYDGDASADVLSPSTFFALFVDRRPAVGGTFFELPDGATVYEGTGLMEVTVSWTDATITGLALRYHSPDMRSGFTVWSEYLQLQQGTPTTITVTPAMTDMPHDAKSRWIFEFAAAGSPGIAEGDFQLKIEIVRMRDIMAFPGHPDTYEDTDRYVLGDEEFTAKGQSRLSQFATFLAGLQSTDTWYPPKPVPMETRALILEVHIVAEGQTAPLARQSGVSVWYTTADSRRDVRAQLLESAEDTYVFGIPVEDRNVDSPYTDASSWHFHIRPRQEVGVGEGVCDGCLDYEMKVHLLLTAYAADPTGKIEPAPEDGRGG